MSEFFPGRMLGYPLPKTRPLQRKQQTVSVQPLLFALVIGACHPGAFLSVANASEGQWRGNIGTEFTYFPAKSASVDNWNVNGSISIDVEYYRDLADNVSLTVHPFFRVDKQDAQRSHRDMRELLITTVGDAWEFNGGLGKVFWGVTESRHLVDVINQTDGVEGIDGEEKLGQPMLNLKLFRELGDFEFFLLPQFRERTFAGANGRPYPGLPVDTSSVQYESSKEDSQPDVAVRWSRSFDAWDIGLHYFAGTARQPALLPEIRANGPVLIPRYQLVQQTGLDAQAIFGDGIVKTEAVYRSGDEIEDHVEAVGGIEYTFVGALAPLQENETISSQACQTAGWLRSFICNDRMDIGLVLEYLWDERGSDADQPFQNDILAGMRFAFNNEASSDALLGVIQDLDGGATTVSLEASKRLQDSYRLSTELRYFTNTTEDAQFSAFRDESFFRVELSYFF